MDKFNITSSRYKYANEDEAKEVNRQKARERYENNREQILGQQREYKRKKREKDKPIVDLYKQTMNDPQLYQNFLNYVYMVNNPVLYQHFVNYVNQMSQDNNTQYASGQMNNNQQANFELVIQPNLNSEKSNLNSLK